MSNLENLIHLNCTEYESKFVIFFINDYFECNNTGLIDSVKYYFFLLNLGMLNGDDYFYLYNELNILLRY